MAESSSATATATEGRMSIKRWAAKADRNQPEIVAALRACGCSVEVIGRPVDLLVGYQGRNKLLEVKDGERPPRERALTEAQQKFFEGWRGDPPVKVETLEQALAAVGIPATANWWSR